MVKAIVKFEDKKPLDLINEAAKVENKDPRVFMAEACMEKTKAVLGEDKVKEFWDNDPEPNLPEDEKTEGG